jgi:hypothetical protein
VFAGAKVEASHEERVVLDHGEDFIAYASVWPFAFSPIER